MGIYAIAATSATRVYGQNAAYVTAKSTSSGFDAGTYIGQNYGDGIYTCLITYLKFATSTVLDSVASVTLSFQVGTDQSATDFDVQIVKYDWSASDPIAAGNRETVYDGAKAASLDLSIWRNTSGMSTGTIYTSGLLDPSWVNKSGSTYYALMSKRHRDETTPTGSEYIQTFTNINLNIITSSGCNPAISPFFMFMKKEMPWKKKGGLWQPQPGLSLA